MVWGKVYLKIDDDMVYISDQAGSLQVWLADVYLKKSSTPKAIAEMVRERLRNRCGLVSANVTISVVASQFA